MTQHELTSRQERKPQWNGETWSSWNGVKYVIDPVQAPPPPPRTVFPTGEPDVPEPVVEQPKSIGWWAAIGLGALILLGIVGVIAHAVLSNPSSGGSASNAAGDVVVSQSMNFTSSGEGQVKVEVTNHSSETSNYVIAVDVASAVGDPLGSGSANVANLAAGATTTIQVPIHDVDQSVALGAQATLKSAVRSKAH
jgi:hypothetical protein